MMDRKAFLGMTLLPAAAMLGSHEEVERGAVLVYPDGRIVSWLDGRIDADSAMAMGVDAVRSMSPPNDLVDGCAWAEPHNDSLGVFKDYVWAGAEVVGVEEVYAADAVVTVLAPFRIDMSDGSYILSASRVA